MADGASSNGRRRVARTRGVGRTGARFPAAPGVEPAWSGSGAADSSGVSAVDHGVGAWDAGGGAEAGPGQWGTGARFGPYSRRRARGREEDVAEDVDLSVAAPSSQPDSRPAAEESTPLPWASAIVRPYTHTGGRTRARRDLAIEALVATSGQRGPQRSASRRLIVELCVRPRSVAEIAALLAVPLGVARVLVGDLAADGAVVVHSAATADVDIMRRVLVGLRRL